SLFSIINFWKKCPVLCRSRQRDIEPSHAPAFGHCENYAGTAPETHVSCSQPPFAFIKPIYLIGFEGL
ncbi:MAG: hypothetical protein LUG15_03830, partial [Oscillospiraceae bacterium]|nr:hypothetical protein [Oscillospiraceae bacterium]